MTAEELRAEMLAPLKRWREAMAAEGLCIRCRRPRGEDGTSRKCRVCANRDKRQQARSRIRRAAK